MWLSKFESLNVKVQKQIQWPRNETEISLVKSVRFNLNH